MTKMMAIMAVCGLLMINGTALATDYWFCASTGDYDDTSSWKLASDCSGSSPSVVPSLNDKATIIYGKLCNIDTQEQLGRLVVERSGDVIGVIKIWGTGKLHLHGNADDGNYTHAIDGFIYLEEEYAELTTSRHNPIFDGDGMIQGKHDGALLTPQSGSTMTNQILINGNLEISGLGIFVNDGIVEANVPGGTIHITGNLNDDGNGVYSTNGTAGVNDTPKLWFDEGGQGGTPVTCLNESFEINIGMLEVDHPGFETNGVLIWSGGKIDCQGAPATFSGSCSD